jgi:uncharacterized repeat protein (TIGR01451 family)
VEFLGTCPAGGNQTWYYKVTGSGAVLGTQGGRCAGVNGVSHISLAYEDCVYPAVPIDVISSTPGGEEKPDGDPSICSSEGCVCTAVNDDVLEGLGFDFTGTDSYKFNQSVACEGAVIISLTTNDVGIGASELALKTGAGCWYGTIIGPGCDNPSIDIQKNACSSQIVSGGTQGQYTFPVVITNDGNVNLTNVEIKENLTGASCVVGAGGAGNLPAGTPLPNDTWVSLNIGLLEGASLNFSVVCTVASSSVNNSISARGTTGAGFQVTDTDTEPCSLDVQRGITIAKACDQVRLVDVGDVVAIQICPRITVTNTGTEALNNVTVTDPELPSSPFSIGTLGPGQTSTPLDAEETCYLPSAVDFDTAPNPPVCPATAQFQNTATASGTGALSGVTAQTVPGSMATCMLDSLTAPCVSRVPSP